MSGDAEENRTVSEKLQGSETSCEKVGTPFPANSMHSLEEQNQPGSKRPQKE